MNLCWIRDHRNSSSFIVCNSFPTAESAIQTLKTPVRSGTWVPRKYWVSRMPPLAAACFSQIGWIAALGLNFSLSYTVVILVTPSFVRWNIVGSAVFLPWLNLNLFKFLSWFFFFLDSALYLISKDRLDDGIKLALLCVVWILFSVEIWMPNGCDPDVRKHLPLNIGELTTYKPSLNYLRYIREALLLEVL